MKVIFFSRFNDYTKDTALYRPGTDGFMQFGMGQFIAHEFLARGYPFTFENWRMDIRIDQIVTREIDGVLYRVFPATMIRHFGEYSREMIRELRKISLNPDIVFHFMPNHPVNFHFLAWFVRKHTIIATHLGGSNPLWEYHRTKKMRYLLRYILEKYIFLRPYNHFITACKVEAEYYDTVNKPHTQMPIFGISRQDQFFIKDRLECRNRLKLPLGKKILLQVGRANDNRGFDWILKLIDWYQGKTDYLLLFVGVNPEDEYYEDLLARDVMLIEHIAQTSLPDYYNAADILYYLPHGEMDLCFAGTSYVPLEALVCGTPVVATTFHHFPGIEVYQVSRRPTVWEDVVPMIEDLLVSNVSRALCREVVLHQFSWNVVIEQYNRLYLNEH